MNKTSSRIDLTAQNWPELASDVDYQPSLLARRWKISVRQLQREFRQQLGTTPQKHLDRVRVNQVQALARRKLRTKEIRVRLRYKHDSQVCRHFRAIVGMGLRAFRQSIG